MKLIPSPTVVRQSLTGHSWIGLLVGVLMYLVCLSGTLAVFYEEFERWEQPDVEEYINYDPQLVEQAFNTVLNSGIEITDHMYVNLPTESIPRVGVSSDNEGWFVNRDGSLGQASNHEWTHLLLNLHLYLHLPSTFGIILVSALGVMLCALIVTGFLAHPRIVKDAFSLRLKGSPRLEQVDIHNRLSVWGAPFHLIIAVTGAWFGLVLPMMVLVAPAYEKTPEEISAIVFGPEPVLDQRVGTVAIASVLEQMPTIAPAARPLFMTVHGVGTPGQFVEVGALHEGRLIYSENYRFDTEGNYLGNAGFSDGEAGRQILYSIYRVHFGHFGGFAVKVLYAVLGLALTVVSVTGINIWLVRRKKQDWLNRAWPALVWGTPASLALSAISQIGFQVPSTAVMWSGVVIAVIYGLRQPDVKRTASHLQGGTAVLILGLLLTYCLRFGADAFSPAGIGVNVILLSTAMLMAWMSIRPVLTKTVSAPIIAPL